MAKIDSIIDDGSIDYYVTGFHTGLGMHSIAIVIKDDMGNEATTVLQGDQTMRLIKNLLGVLLDGPDD